MKTFLRTLYSCVLLFTGLFASSQIPVFNSYPASANVVFLDFDGHIVNGTSWNGSGPIVCNGANLTTAQITSIFNRVAEDYRPFTVNITTDSTKYAAAPADKRMRVVLTTSSSWYGAAGGVSYMNSFTWGDNTPCFVFTALLNYNTKYIAEAASHEIGHTLGLRHQASYDQACNITSEYNGGTGSGEIGWAPIMGVGYYENMTLWNNGANPYGCTSYQDDLSIITGNGNGIGYRTDDHANTMAGATTASFTNNSFTINGIIETPGDVDMIKFTAPANGRFLLDALPYSIGAGNTGADVDLEIALLNNAQTIIGTYNPGTTLNASIDTQLNAGTYYLRVQGKGNIYAPNYASLGSYSLNGSITIGNPLPLHKLQLTGTIEGKQHKLGWEIIADETVVKQVLEVSNDGVAFQPLPASLLSSARDYTYLANKTTILYYRLNVLFDNGRQFYSNIISLRNNGSNARPYLIGNLIDNTITVSSPSSYHYSIHDLAGRTIASGILVQGLNTIPVRLSGNGLYLIEYYNADEFYTEKFMKR